MCIVRFYNPAKTENSVYAYIINSSPYVNLKMSDLILLEEVVTV